MGLLKKEIIIKRSKSIICSYSNDVA